MSDSINYYEDLSEAKKFSEIINSFYSPMNTKSNSYQDETKELTLKWLNKYHLIDSQKHHQEIIKIMPWKFASYAVPNATLEVSAYFAKWISIVFLIDDELEGEDDKEILKDIQKYIDAYFEVIDFKENQFKTNLSEALKSLMIEQLSFSNPLWTIQFQKSVKYYIEGCLKESFYRTTNQQLNYDEYKQIRLQSAALHLFFDLVELSVSEYLPQSFKIDEEFEKYRETASLIDIWMNDIFSFPKEFNSKDKFNMVTVYMNSYKYDLERSRNEVINLHNSEILNLTTLEEKILNKYKNNSEYFIIAEWIENMKLSITGIYLWSKENNRYKVDINF